MKTLYHLEPKAQEVIDACEMADAPLHMTVEGFQTDQEALHLRDMLWYARSRGVQVVIIPGSQEEVMKDADLQVRENY